MYKFWKSSCCKWNCKCLIYNEIVITIFSYLKLIQVFLFKFFVGPSFLVGISERHSSIWDKWYFIHGSGKARAPRSFSRRRTRGYYVQLLSYFSPTPPRVLQMKMLLDWWKSNFKKKGKFKKKSRRGEKMNGGSEIRGEKMSSELPSYLKLKKCGENFKWILIHRAIHTPLYAAKRQWKLYNFKGFIRDFRGNLI